MEKLSQKELRHTNRVKRVLEKAKRALLGLVEESQTQDVFPRTTLKAYTEVSDALHRAELRVTARSADAA
jgi:hypothetical protein